MFTYSHENHPCYSRLRSSAFYLAGVSGVSGGRRGGGEGGWNFLLLTLTTKGTGGTKVSSQVRESKFRNPGLFCCGIQNPELWNPEYGSRNPAQARNPPTIGILNPSSTDKKSGIRNPWSGIQNLPFPCRERLVIWDRVFSLFSLICRHVSISLTFS